MPETRRRNARNGSRQRKATRRAKPAAEPRLSRLRPPERMSIEAWQAGLRRQFGREQGFTLENIAEERIFSEFRVTNPDSGGRYRVAIRGTGLGESYCSCPDFATNELGTCKHIEFTLARLERRRGGKKALEAGFEPPYSEIWLQYGAQRVVRFRPGRRCPRKVLALARDCFEQDDGWSLPLSHLGRLEGFVSGVRALGRELRVYEDVRDFVAEIEATRQRRSALAELYPQGAHSPQLQGLLRLPLHRYQAEGALFAAGAGRAIIADEMGLGKTAQAMAAAEILRRHFGLIRAVVVCPTSLMHQWGQELARFTGREARLVTGSRQARTRLYAAPAEYLIVSYDTLLRDFELLAAWRPELLIADEAQRIKNWNTRAARTLKRLETPYAFVLTGTPLENRLEELVSIVELVDRRRLGPTWRFLARHQEREETGRVIGYRHLDEIGETLAPIMIRRHREDVLKELPPRSQKSYFVPLTPQQRKLHEEQAEIVARIVAKWRRSRSLSDADQKRLMAALQTMRMVCDSTYLIDQRSDHGRKLREIAMVVEELLEPRHAKVVIFSQWLRMHELLSALFARRGWGHVLFHGGVPSRQRGRLIERFRDDADCRLFLATDAGGVGLNLQHAGAVVNADLPWNPAVLEQRIGRVHRLGQHGPVRVANFVAEGGIEEHILSLLEFKGSMFAGALDGGEAFVQLKGSRLTRFMERVEQVSAPHGEAPSSAVGEREGAMASPSASVPKQTANTSSQATAASGENPWQPLLELGRALLGELAGTDGASAQWLEQDPDTGRRYLRVPVPEPEAVERLASALHEVLASNRSNGE